MSKVKSFLIVDDDLVARRILERRLIKCFPDSKIITACNGRDALDFLESHTEDDGPKGEFPPVIIFLDINMPIMNGFEFLDSFSSLRKNRNDLKSIVFTMYTSSNCDDDIEKSKKFEVVRDFIIKGELTNESLIKIVNKYV